MKFEILCFEDFLEVKTYGDAELKGFKDFILAILAHEKWHPGGAILVNHSELNAATLTTDELREVIDFSEFFQSKIGPAKIAILATGDLEFGLGRIWQVFASEGKGIIGKIFRSRDEAISWLIAAK